MQNISLALAISSTVPAKDVAHTDTHGVYQGYVKWRTLTDPLTERLKNVGTQYPDLLRDEETIKGILPPRNLTWHPSPGGVHSCGPTNTPKMLNVVMLSEFLAELKKVTKK